MERFREPAAFQRRVQLRQQERAVFRGRDIGEFVPDFSKTPPA
ncbi:MAG: hypothetical protein ACLUEQ_04375 [Cloacibacillus evryensis]